MKKLHKMMKAFAVCVALALVFCMIPVGSVYAETNAGTGNESGNGENGGTPSIGPVTVTIDNSAQQFDIILFKDGTSTDGGNCVYEDENGKIECSDIDITKARIGIKLRNDNTYVWPENLAIDGLKGIFNENFSWFRAFYTINEAAVNKQDNTVSITIPTVDTTCSSIETHKRTPHNVYYLEDGTHCAQCYTCRYMFDKAPHTFEKMTVFEAQTNWYSDEYYKSNNDKDQLIEKDVKTMCDELGVTPDTVINYCAFCGYAEKLPTQDTTSTDNKTDTSTSSDSSTSSSTSSQPAPTPAPAVQQPAAVETPVSQPVTAALADAEGVFPTGAVIVAATVSSGATYEKAVEVIKAQVSGLGEFSVMEINLTDAANTQVHQLNGYVQVTVPMPANITVKEGKAIVVYRLEDDGTLTRCDTTVDNGVITFKTNHFSTYIVAEEDVTAVTSPKTEDVSAGINLIFCMGILLAGAAAVAVKRKMA